MRTRWVSGSLGVSLRRDWSRWWEFVFSGALVWQSPTCSRAGWGTWGLGSVSAVFVEGKRGPSISAPWTGVPSVRFPAPTLSPTLEVRVFKEGCAPEAPLHVVSA